VADKLVRFTRPALVEEYSVSVDGLRQDFLITAPPAGVGDLRVELALSGARAVAAAGGVKLRLEGSGRELAYGCLRAEDATGRELKARLEILSAGWLAVSVADANATYPVRIDPTFSDADWGSLNPGMPGADRYVLALAADDSGNVYVAGFFSYIGTVPANGIAKWDGSSWSALGSGMDGIIEALAVSGTNLYAGGSFTTAGGVPARYVAKWDGSAWSPLGSGMNGNVYALAVSGTNLYAGGFFTTAGGVPANYIAKWDGSAWSPLGSGLRGGGLYPYAFCSALAVSWTDLYVGGNFAMAGINVSPYAARLHLASVPTILESPQSQTAEIGSTIFFTLDIAGGPLVTYHWVFNDTNVLSRSSNAILTLTNVQPAQAGGYTVVVSNLLGAVTSAPAMLNVIAPLERRLVPGINLTGEAVSLLNLDYVNSINPAPDWLPAETVSLGSTSQFYFDLSTPPSPQRFYRAWQTGTPSVTPALDLHLIPALTFTGSVGGKLQVDGINQFGPTDAWFPLDTVTVTNTSQFYFDVFVIGQPPRLYRLVPIP
jgi:hypothetical protein